MPNITGGEVYWEPGPAPSPIRGLFDVAEVVGFSDAHQALGVEYLTNRCHEAEAWLEMCEAATDKGFFNPDLVVGVPFAVYDSSECKMGMSVDEAKAQLQASFEVKVEAVAEARLQALLLAETPVSFTTLTNLVASHEDALAARYAGRGIIHMGRGAGVRANAAGLFQTVESNTAQVQTINGTPVALGRGYKSTAGFDWVGVTGRVVVLRGPILSFDAPSSESTLQRRALIEQQFVLVAECVKAWGEVAVP